MAISQTFPTFGHTAGAILGLAGGTPGSTVNLNLSGAFSKPSSSITIIIVLTLLSVAPSLLVMMTGFVRVVVVLSITRNALGLPAAPPNQVLAGLALFISLFIMAPTLNQIDKVAIKPYMAGQITAVQAYDLGQVPLKTWMLKQTDTQELAMFTQAAGDHPATVQDVSMTALIPAFVLSQLRSAFIMGFIIYIPFLIIDLVVSSALMSLGMMMLPPTLISLPFKLLLFVLVDGWGLVVHSLLVSFR